MKTTPGFVVESNNLKRCVKNCLPFNSSKSDDSHQSCGDHANVGGGVETQVVKVAQERIAEIVKN